MNTSKEIKYIKTPSLISNRNYRGVIIFAILFYIISVSLVGLNKIYGPFHIIIPFTPTHLFSTSVCREEAIINYSPYTRDVFLIIAGGYSFTFFTQVSRLYVSVFNDLNGSIVIYIILNSVNIYL